jgi:hypothetical protein
MARFVGDRSSATHTSQTPLILTPGFASTLDTLIERAGSPPLAELFESVRSDIVRVRAQFAARRVAVVVDSAKQPEPVSK